jgi:hypothetical protein
MHRAGSFAGAACFHAFRPYQRRDENRGVIGHVPKRLPSRRWAIVTSHERATSFEDEDDAADEYEERRARLPRENRRAAEKRTSDDKTSDFRILGRCFA